MFPRRNKFNAAKSRCSQDHIHDSGAEARRCDYLHLAQRAGESVYGGHIERIESQPRLALVVNGVTIQHYKPDFGIAVRRGTKEIIVHEDVKGWIQKDFVRTRKLYDALHDEPLRVVKEKGRGWVEV